MTTIYQQHEAAFAAVSAYVILDPTGERVATVAIKFPRDGASRLYAYVHLIGVEMVRDYASGFGYDKRSAAVAAAIAKIPAPEGSDDRAKLLTVRREALQKAAKLMESRDWTDALREPAGLTVLQAV